MQSRALLNIKRNFVRFTETTTSCVSTLISIPFRRHVSLSVTMPLAFSISEYGRAFRPAAIPPDRKGLAEFGMGMKSAACWFAPRWIVRTSALGEPVTRTIYFDIENIVNDDIEELAFQEIHEASETHYTEIVLEDIFRVPVGRTVGKLKEHLAGIYRVFIRDGILELRFNNDPLQYHEPEILNAAYFKDEAGPKKGGAKPIEFNFGNGLSVDGFAALRDPASTTRAGFLCSAATASFKVAAMSATDQPTSLAVPTATGISASLVNSILRDSMLAIQKTASAGMTTNSRFWNCLGSILMPRNCRC